LVPGNSMVRSGRQFHKPAKTNTHCPIQQPTPPYPDVKFIIDTQLTAIYSLRVMVSFTMHPKHRFS
jgi:hypothetical protein